MTMLPSNKSALGLRGDWPSGTYALSRVATASLNLGLGDFAFLLDTTITSDPGDCIIFSKTGGAPLRGYIFRYTGGALRITLYDVAGNSVHFTTPTLVGRGRNPIVVFGDRDGNLEIYEKGVNVLTVVMGATNIDQDNVAGSNCNYNSFPASAAQDISGFQFYNFVVDTLPDAAERAQIVSEWTSDPYSIPPVLFARVNHAVELRLHMDFLSEDPASTVVTDKSANGSDMTLAAAATWSDVGKEMKTPTRILTPDGGPTFGMKSGRAYQAGLSGISVGTSDVIFEYIILRYVEDIAFQTKVGSTNPYYFMLADVGVNWFASRVDNGTGDLNYRISGIPHEEVLNVRNVFPGMQHFFCITRETNLAVFLNGHEIRDNAKAAHNIATTRLFLAGQTVIGGESVPSTLCLLRIYIGDLSGFTDLDLLDIHQQYLSYPYETPFPLAAYEKFRFTGRMPDGSQIVPTSTVVYNEKNGETLQIQGGLTWQDVREAVHV